MDFNITLHFRNSSSVNFPDAIRYANKFEKFKKAESKKDLNQIRITKNDLDFNKHAFLKLIEIVKSWKGTAIKLNSKPISDTEITSLIDIISCNSNYEKAVIQESHCNISSENEGWGCKFLTSINYRVNRYWQNSEKNWYDFGSFKSDTEWEIDKKKLKEILLRESEMKQLNLCSIFDLEKVSESVESLPDTIDTCDSNSWEIKYQDNIDGSVIEQKPIGIKPKESKRNSGTSVRLSFGESNNTEKLKEETSNRNIPNVKYSDIGGIDRIIKRIREAIEIPFLKPELIKYLGIQPHKGIVLTGPPGTGKTLIAKAIANQVKAHFISIKGPELISKWHGQSEENLRNIFEEAKQNSPSIIFFDEIDSIAQRRSGEENLRIDSRFVNQLLTLMDGLEQYNDVRIIATTNRLELIDEALLRPGRFDYKIEVPKPNEEAIFQILEIHCQNVPLDSDVDLMRFSKKLKGLSGAEIAYVVRESAYNSLRRSLDNIEIEYITNLDDRDFNRFKIKQIDLEMALNSLN